MYVGIRLLQGCLAVVGNSFTIISVARFQSLRTASNILIANLGLCDLMHGLVILIVFPIRTFIDAWEVRHPSCLLLVGLEVLLVFSQYTVFMLLGIERLMVLRSKLGMNATATMSMRTILVTLPTCWVVIIVYVVLMTIYTAEYAPGMTCSTSYIFPVIYRNVAIAYFSITTCVVGYVYIRIGIMVCGRCRQVAPSGLSTQARSDLSVARMLGMVVGLFFMLYLPFMVLGSIVKPDSPELIRFLYYVNILVYDLNFWINPIIYAWRNKDFRKAFRSLLGTRLRVEPRCVCSCPRNADNSRSVQENGDNTNPAS